MRNWRKAWYELMPWGISSLYWWKICERPSLPCLMARWSSVFKSLFMRILKMDFPIFIHFSIFEINSIFIIHFSKCVTHFLRFLNDFSILVIHFSINTLNYDYWKMNVYKYLSIFVYGDKTTSACRTVVRFGIFVFVNILFDIAHLFGKHINLKQ